VRIGLKSAKKAGGRSENIIFSCFLTTPLMAQVIGQTIRFRGSSLPIWLRSAISANFIARLIKGCRGDVPAGCFA
jgi:hypothetical protein